MVDLFVVNFGGLTVQALLEHWPKTFADEIVGEFRATIIHVLQTTVARLPLYETMNKDSRCY